VSRSNDGLTTTSYAILGLLAIQPWTTYELAQHMDRTLGRLWPRAQSKIYEEPKKLVAMRLAHATSEATGRRPRTVYGITAKGRRALGAWLAEPGAPPSLEYEQLLKVFFAEHGSKADLVAQLENARDWALGQRLIHLAMAESYLSGSGRFPERAAILSLTGRFVFEFNEMVLNWAEFALAAVRDWPGDPGKAEVDWRIYEDMLARRDRSVRPGSSRVSTAQRASRRARSRTR